MLAAPRALNTWICIFCIFCILRTYYAYYYQAYFAKFAFILNHSCTRPSQSFDTISWPPIPGPSYLRISTNNHHHVLLICSRMLREFSWFSSHVKGYYPGSTHLGSWTRGRRPRMEDTGTTYKTCACSRRPSIIANWHCPTQAEVDTQYRICILY